jgi:CBS domain-containing protein
MKSAPISSIMTRHVISVSPEQKLLDVKHIYEKKKFHHHIPVLENEELIGIISLIDFMYHIKGAGIDDQNPIYTELTVKDIMTSNPYSVSSNTSIEDVADELTKGRFRAIPVVDNKTLVGIVTTADLIQHYLRQSVV